MSLSKAEQKSYASMRARFGGDAVGLSVSITSPGSLRATSSSELRELQPVEEGRDGSGRGDGDEEEDEEEEDDDENDDNGKSRGLILVSVSATVSGGDGGDAGHGDHDVDDQGSRATSSVSIDMLLRNNVVTSLIMLLGCRTLGVGGTTTNEEEDETTGQSAEKVDVSELEKAALSGTVLAEAAELLATLARVDARFEKQARVAFALIQDSAAKDSLYVGRVSSRMRAWLPQLGVGGGGEEGGRDDNEGTPGEAKLRKEVQELEVALRNARTALAALGL